MASKTMTHQSSTLCEDLKDINDSNPYQNQTNFNQSQVESNIPSIVSVVKEKDF